MSFKNLRIIRTNECTRNEFALHLGDVHIGFVADMTTDDNGSWKLDGVIITKGPDANSDSLLAVEFINGYEDLVEKGVNTANFTKKIARLFNRHGKGWSSRFYRGYYETRNGNVYDASDKLVYDDSRNTRAGEVMNHPIAISKRAVSVIARFGIIKPYSRRGRFVR